MVMKRRVRTIAGSTLTTSYQNLGTLVDIAAFKIAIVNGSTTDIMISDGTANDAFYVLANSTLSVGEGLAGGLQQLDKQAIVPGNTTYQIKLPSGVAGTGNIAVTIEGF